MEELINLNKFYLTAQKHANDPHHMGSLNPFNGHAKVTGPCGDTMYSGSMFKTGKLPTSHLSPMDVDHR